MQASRTHGKIFRTGALLLLCFLIYTGLPAQSEWRQLFYIPQVAKFIAADKLQQLYLVTSENEVIKYSQEGQLLYRFNNNTLGDLARIDATDPFNLLLYYPDFQVVLLLDRTLNPLGEYNLWEYGLFQPPALGMANDNLLWVYDEVEFRLKKLDRQGNVIAKSDDLNLLLPRAPKPADLIARNNQVYLNDPQIGVLLFDNFGQYLKTLPVTGISKLQMLEEGALWGRQNGKWMRYDLLAMETKSVFLPIEAAEQQLVLLFRNRAYVLQDDGVRAWGR